MGLEAALALIPVAERLFADGVSAYQTYQNARATLSVTDRATLDAAFEASTIKRQLDELRVLAELAAAEQR